MIDRNHALPITRQAELVGISRGGVYDLSRATSEAEQRLMKRIDVLNLAHPFAGSRMLRDMLNREGFAVGRRHVATLMQRMGIRALYRQAKAGIARYIDFYNTARPHSSLDRRLPTSSTSRRCRRSNGEHER
jgi:transposase InsO family protein